MAAATVSILVCDSHPLIRSGICTALASQPDMTVAAAVSTWAATSAVVSTHPPQIAVVEEQLFSETVLKYPLDPPRFGAVITVDHICGDRLLSLIRCGVRAIVRRCGRSEDIVRAVRSVACGNGLLAPELVAPLFGAIRRGPSHHGVPGGLDADLTAREQDVLGLLSRGAANREIAAVLRITEKTVKFHVSNLLAKSRVRSRAQLIARLAGSSPDRFNTAEPAAATPSTAVPRELF